LLLSLEETLEVLGTTRHLSAQSCRSGSTRRADLTFLRELGRLDNTDLFYISRMDVAHLEGNLYKPNVERSLLILNNMSGFGNSTVDADILKTLNQYGTF
jgi:hypothetical protein